MGTSLLTGQQGRFILARGLLKADFGAIFRLGEQGMSGPGDVATQWLAAARAGSSEALGQALEACRNYLLLIALRELDSGLQAKGGASDLVQETMVDALRDFRRFHGSSEAELQAWLRELLLHNL